MSTEVVMSVSAEVEERLMESYRAHHATTFGLQQLEEEHVGTHDELLRAVADLEAEGKVQARATLYCGAGHTTWTGMLREMSAHEGDVCRFCEQDDPGTAESAMILIHLQPSLLERSKKKSPHR